MQSRYAVTVMCSLLVAAGLAAQPGDSAQQPVRDQQPPIRVEANFVRVDVYPTKGGQPLHGLRADDFEVFEDGVAQRVEAFEHVVISPAGPQDTRREPGSERESLQAAANPRNRVFVIFLDVPHVSFEGSYHIRDALVRLLDRVLGPDDLVGVMTPAMSASNLVLARKTQAIEAGLMRDWPWGERFRDRLDATELEYVQCYPKTPCEQNPEPYSPLAIKLIERKRERATLEALQDLVRYLGAVREERKAVLTVTEGWLQMREDPEIMKLRRCKKWEEPIPGIDEIQVGPDGRLTTRERRERTGATKYGCDTERMRLAAIDNELFFRQIMDDANRANTSFYPIDPRGLPVFDTPIGGTYAPPPPVSVDAAMLTRRLESMRTLAVNTDGLAVLNSNDMDAGLRRIADDLTSYYLLGYYSTNPKLDGKFRRLTVRVKQPGVEVRARRGYRAPTTEEIESARLASEAPVPESVSALTAALGTLARIRPDAPFRINAVSTPSSGDPRSLWVAGELQPSALRSEDFQLGGTADIEVTAGGRSSGARVTLKPGERTFLAEMKMPPGAEGQVTVKARLAGEGGGMPLTDAVQVEVAAAQPLLFRRGLSTGNRVLPAADFRFSRTERLRLELPVGAEVMPGEGRVLDKAGQPLQVPVTVGERVDDASGQRWITAEVVLAPLAAGDYAVEIGTLSGSTGQRVVTGIRVTR